MKIILYERMINMLLKITEKCSMGCTHCLSDCKPDGKHMSFEMLQQSLDFILNNKLSNFVIISGGEPCEHPEWMKFAKYVIERCCNSKTYVAVMITTNGFWFAEHQDKALELLNTAEISNLLSVQVSTDKRYYTKQIPLDLPLWSNPHIELCVDCVQMMTPLGRAKTNDLHFNDHKASSCFNIRSVAHQMRHQNGSVTLCELIHKMESMMRFCQPAITIEGKIQLSESNTCPVVSDIFKPNHEIMQDILNFNCNHCHLNDGLPDLYRKTLSL